MKSFNPHPYAMTFVALAICGVMAGTDGIGADTSATVTTTTFDATAISVLNRDGQPVVANAQMTGRSKIKIAGAPAGSAAFFEEDGQQPEALVPNADVPGEYWLPLVTLVKNGRVVLRHSGAVVFSMPLLVEPFGNPNAVGDVAESALQARMASREDALAALRKDGRSPDAVSLLEQAYTIDTQMLEWIQQARANGAAVMAHAKDGQPVMMTTEDVKRMDQEELWRLSLFPNFTGSQVSRLDAKELMDKLASLLISSAHAQANASACMPKSPTLDNTIRQRLYQECSTDVTSAKIDEVRAYIEAGVEFINGVGATVTAVAPLTAASAPAVIAFGEGIILVSKTISYAADSVAIVAKATAGDAAGAVDDATDVALKAAAGKLLDKSLKALKESAHGFLTQMDNVLENNQQNAKFYAKFADPLNMVIEKQVGDDYLSEIVKGDGSAETQSQPQSEPLPVPGGGITPVPDPSSPPADQSQSEPLPVPGGGITPSTVPTTPTTSTPETIVTTTPTTDPRNKICELATGKADSRDPCSDRTPTSTPPTSTPPTSTAPTSTPPTSTPPTTNPTTTPTTAPAITPTTTPSTTPPTSSGFCDRTDGHLCGVP